MKNIKKILLLFTLVGSIACTAQSFKVIKATSQEWSGGVAGRYGHYYTIVIETSSKTATPDTLWISGESYALDFSKKNSAFKKTYDSASHKTTFSISVGDAHDENQEMRKVTQPKDTAKKETPKPTRSFKGAALISYSFKHKQHYFIVNSFTQLEPIAYP